MKFSELFTMKQDTLKKEIAKSLKHNGYTVISEKGFLFAYYGIPKKIRPVMLVAHLDTVHKDPVSVICRSSDGNILMAPEGIGGDDRCGVYALLKVASKLGCYLLFTEDEETGCQGAKKFCEYGIRPEINYIIEIDRKGNNDSVFYDCDNKKFEDWVNTFGFKTNIGSCSDISYIAPYLKVAAVNLSSGYYNPHTQYEYINMADLNRTVDRIIKMVSTKTDLFEYIKKVYVAPVSKYSYKSSYHGNSYKNAFFNNSYYEDSYYDNDNSYPEIPYDYDLKKYENVIWLFSTDYLVKLHSDTISAENYGIDVDGHLYYWTAYGNIIDAKWAKLCDKNGHEVDAKAIYDLENEKVNPTKLAVLNDDKK